MNPVKFQIYTGLLKAFEGPGGERRFRTTASSTIADLAGDEIMPPAIEKMAEKAKGNLTIFLNHEYRVPEDVLGSVEATTMNTRGVDSEGAPIVDLDFDIRLNDSNPRALQTYEAIKSGVKLGTSIGAIVRHATKKKGGGHRIDDLELLEASIVGIPANPRSWVQYAMKSFNKADEEARFLVLGNGFPEEDLPELTVEEEKAAEPDLTAAGCPTCGKGQGMGGDCSNPYHKAAEPAETTTVVPDEITAAQTNETVQSDAEPDKEAARTRVTVTVDSDGAPEAPKSEPELAVTDEDLADKPTDDATAALGDVTRAVDSEFAIAPSELASVVKSFKDLTTKYVELQKKYDEEHERRLEVEENFGAAQKIFDRIADLPLGRKTHFVEAVGEYRARFPQYDTEFIKFLEKE